jgi:hypothetical protein
MSNDRVKVTGSYCIVKLIIGGRDAPDSGLILHGEKQCYDLAEELIRAGERISEHRRKPLQPASNGRNGSAKR